MEAEPPIACFNRTSDSESSAVDSPRPAVGGDFGDAWTQCLAPWRRMPLTVFGASRGEVDGVAARDLRRDRVGRHRRHLVAGGAGAVAVGTAGELAVKPAVMAGSGRLSLPAASRDPNCPNTAGRASASRPPATLRRRPGTLCASPFGARLHSTMGRRAGGRACLRERRARPRRRQAPTLSTHLNPPPDGRTATRSPRVVPVGVQLRAGVPSPPRALIIGEPDQRPRRAARSRSGILFICGSDPVGHVLNFFL